MRVIAGSARGTRLYAPKGSKVRPVIDRVKEGLFGVLGDRVPGARVLDLFAGSGSLGIEALSRGAEHCDFIEKHRATAQVIKANLERAHLAERGGVINAELPGALSRVKGPYGLIFIDPPFRIDRRSLEEVFRRVRLRGLLEPGEIAVYRHSPRDRNPPQTTGWALSDSRDYGDSIISIYRTSDAQETTDEE